jgi:hypothetical protein
MNLLGNLKIANQAEQRYSIIRPKHMLYKHTNFVVINFEKKVFKASFLNIRNLILVVILSFCGVNLNAFAETNPSISDKLKNIESNTEECLGVFVISTENGHVAKSCR